MTDTIVFLDANVLASPVTRTLVIAGGRAEGLLVTWSAHVEAEADRHARGSSSRTSKVRREILGMELSESAPSLESLQTTSLEDRQVLADAVCAGARFLVAADVGDFALDDLRAHSLSAINPDYFIDLNRTSERSQTPLAGAVFKGYVEVFRVLMVSRADPGGGTPSARAAAKI